MPVPLDTMGPKEASGIKPSKKGAPKFFRGEEVAAPAPKEKAAGAERAQITDGIIGETYTEGGRAKVHIHRIYESKAGKEAAKGLPAQAEWDYERIKEVGIWLGLPTTEGTADWVYFAPKDISMPPRTIVHGFLPAGVKPVESKDVTRAYTPRTLPDITEAELDTAALMVHRGKAGGE